MKKGFVLQSLFCLLAVSCSVHEIETMNPTIPAENDVFYASLESYSKPDTKVYLDTQEEIKILWDAKDRISIFNKSTMNQEFEFMGETGDNAGYFKRVSEGSGTRAVTDYICAVYPFQESTSLDESGVLTLDFPAEQTYKVNSFGPGANPMVSTTKENNNLLSFKNVGGYMVLKFFGSDVSVSSIKLEGRDGEHLSGEATMEPTVGSDPAITIASTAGTSISLTCNTAVKLGKTQNKAITFWMVVPPTTFMDGYTLTVTDKYGTVYLLETDQETTITRNCVFRITSEVKLNPKKVIYYTSSDHKVIQPDENANFGANILSNAYDGEKGILVFDGSVTRIDDNAFKGCERLTSITIPEDVTSIGSQAFYGCTALSSITVNADNPPTGVTNESFEETNECPIYVPVSSISKYREAWTWFAYRLYVIPPQTELNGHAYINMGNDLKWATMNIGAASETDFGKYFAWGETEPKETYTMGNYVLATIPTTVTNPNLVGWKYINKYTIADGKTDASWYESGEFTGDGNTTFADFDYEDDAARIIWKKTWRTPTKDEWQWLIDNCIVDFVANYKNSGKSGLMFTSTINGYELFLPMAGYRYSDALYSNYGLYWSSTLSSNESDYAVRLHFTDGSSSSVSLDDIDRLLGYPIRPVSD